MAVNGEQNQQYNQDADQKEQAPNTGGGAADTPSAAGASAPGSRVAASSSGQQAGSTGSGRFTNLQKYIGANQGAGERLGSGITNKVSRENEGTSKEAATSASAVRDGIASAQDKLQTGNQYKEQLNSDSFNAKDIAGDQNKLQDFSNYRTGSAIDEAQLAKSNQAAQTNFQNLQNQMQTQLGQTQTDTGRFNMLKNTFGGGSVYQNPYTQGQQRLDGLFLQSGGGNQIGQLQNNLRSGVSAAGQQLGQLDASGKTIGDITTQESDLAKSIQDGITGKTTGYVNDIAATEANVNAQRAADQAWAAKQYGNLQGNQAIDQKFADLLGLNQGQTLYHSLSDKNVNSLLDFGPQELKGADQLANQDQRQYYDALAQLSGLDSNSYAINKNGTNAPGAVTNKNTINDVLTGGTSAYEQAINNANGGYTWGGGAIVPINASLGLGTAGSALTGISSAGADKLKTLGNTSFNDFWGDQSHDMGQLSAMGFSPEDAQKIYAASQQSNVSGGSANGVAQYGTNAKFGSVQNALQQLSDQGFLNRVNIVGKT